MFQHYCNQLALTKTTRHHTVRNDWRCLQRSITLVMCLWFTASVVIAAFHTHRHFTTPTLTQACPDDDCFLCELTNLGGGSLATTIHTPLATLVSAPFYAVIPSHTDQISVESVFTKPTRGPPQTLTSTHFKCPNHNEMAVVRLSIVSSGGYPCIVHLRLLSCSSSSQSLQF